jgi:hypothetical protein
MPAFNPLRTLLLAYLHSVPTGTVSRYEAMTKINLFFGKVDKPYSPGAIYHETGKLERDKLIEFNQDKISPTSASLRWLQTQLTTTPLPSSILGKLTFLVAASLLADNRVRETALKRLEISMIDSNQYGTNPDPLTSDIESATNICLSNLLLAARRSVLDIGAYDRDANN